MSNRDGIAASVRWGYGPLIGESVEGEGRESEEGMGMTEDDKRDYMIARALEVEAA